VVGRAGVVEGANRFCSDVRQTRRSTGRATIRSGSPLLRRTSRNSTSQLDHFVLRLFLDSFNAVKFRGSPNFVSFELMPPTVEEFRKALIGAEAPDLVDRYLLAPEAAHVNVADRDHIASSIAASFGLSVSDLSVIITGSAKLGFSISEKHLKDGTKLPRYRLFSARSDIDVAVISRLLFDQLWHELSAHSHSSPLFPRKAGRLGDYLVCGWLRQDHFPAHTRLPRCDAWADSFRRLSANSRFRRRKVSGGLFSSLHHLRQYMSRAVRDCIAEEKL
jgi:hypothetical protein